MSIDISIVIPVYFSGAIIPKTVEEIETVIKGSKTPYTYEIILVNDGSKDNSYSVIKGMAESNNSIAVFDLMRNFGQHNAIMAGLHHASGKYIILMDDDGQHDPKNIFSIINELKEGYDAVYVQYPKKIDVWYKDIGSKVNDYIARSLLQKPSDLYLNSFMGMTALLKKQILQYDGPNPYVHGIILTSTQNIGKVIGEHRSTEKQATTYTLRKLFEHFLNMGTNFSIKPLRMIFQTGVIIGMIALFTISVYTLRFLFFDVSFPPGWTTLFFLMLFFGALQFIAIGLVGEYVGRILLFLNKKPQFIVKDEFHASKDES